MTVVAKLTVCQHCHKGKVNRPRGLCWGCWHDPAVRFIYPVGSGNPDTARYVPKTYGGRGRGEEDDEPTMEELERMIAEQYPTMPPASPWELAAPPPSPRPRRS